MTLTFNWSTVATIVTGLSGFAGVVLTPILGTALTGGVQAILIAISGLLAILGGGTAMAVTYQAMKLKNALKIAAAHQVAPTVEIHVGA
jgi:hypothetical protein